MHQSEFDVNTCNFWFWICLLLVEKVAQVLPSNRRTSLCKTEATANYSRFLFSCMWLLAVSFWAVESEPSSALSDWSEEKQKRSYRPSCNPVQLSCLSFQIPRTPSQPAQKGTVGNLVIVRKLEDSHFFKPWVPCLPGVVVVFSHFPIEIKVNDDI